MSSFDAFPVLVEQIEETLRELDIISPDSGVGADTEKLFLYCDSWGRIHEAIEIAEIHGLSDITEFIHFNTLKLTDSAADGGHVTSQIRILRSAGPVLSSFLRNPLDSETLAKLIQYLQKPDWPVPMGEDQAYTVMAKLLDQMQDLEEDAGGESEAELSEEDFRLSIPEDIHPQLLQAFFDETPQLAERFSQHIENIVAGRGSADDLLQAQRFAHTIKGSSHVAGVPAISTLMHFSEDLLELLYKRGVMPSAELSHLLMEIADCLAAQTEFLREEGSAPENTRELVEQLRRSIQSDLGDQPLAIQTTATEEDTEITDDAGAIEVKGSLALADSMRVSSELIEKLLRQAGEVSISTVQLEGLSSVISQRLKELSKHQALINDRMNALQELVELKNIPSFSGSTALSDSRDSQFDPLEMDEYNELHSATSFLGETVMDIREYINQLSNDFTQLRNMLKQQDVVSRELNDSVLGTRLVSFSAISPRLNRAARQTAHSTNKHIDFEIIGEEAMVDSAVLAKLTDPLMHLLRNAIDHGIESEDMRLAMSKPSSGSVRIEVERRGDNVSILISDDGRGLDYERIKAVAVERGFVNDASQLSDQDLARLILLPGFSTREETTHISGRGIGMDVVHASILDQRGTLNIESIPGSGTTVSILVPMTLISVHTLLVRIQGIIMGVPSSSVQQLIFSDLGEWEYRDDELKFIFEDREYSSANLSKLVGIQSTAPLQIPEKAVPLLLIQGELGSHAVFLEEVVDSRYLVLKRLGRYFPKISGVIGAAILGDGSVAAVLDVRELLRMQESGEAAAMSGVHLGVIAEQEKQLPAVLVVDDSVSARRSLAELVSDAGYRSMTAVDGMDALKNIQDDRPVAILLDLEMPRMNGLELAAHIRADTELSNIPLIMVTSRSTEKHRQQAMSAGVDRFITKPYQEDLLIQEINTLVH